MDEHSYADAPTEALMKDVKCYIEPGKAMHLHAIDGLIIETRVRRCESSRD